MDDSPVSYQFKTLWRSLRQSLQDNIARNGIIAGSSQGSHTRFLRIDPPLEVDLKETLNQCIRRQFSTYLSVLTVTMLWFKAQVPGTI